MLKNTKSDDKFVTILSDGTLRVAVPEGTEGAVKREYETSDGKKGTKHEMVYTELSGTISKIKFYEGDYGKLLQLTIIDDEDEEVTLSVGTATNYGEDLMKKLPNVDLKAPVRLAPYSFEDDKGKTKRGVTVYQDEEKIANYFYDTEKEKLLHGYPEPKFKKKNPGKDDWKAYFLNARIFLIDFLTEHFDIEEETKKEKPDKKDKKAFKAHKDESKKKKDDTDDEDDDSDEDEDDENDW